MAATYGSPTQIRAWTNPSYAPNKKYDVIPYKANVAITADQQLNLGSLDEADAAFQVMLSATLVNPLKYDQIEIKEKLIVVPS